MIPYSSLSFNIFLIISLIYLIKALNDRQNLHQLSLQDVFTVRIRKSILIAGICHGKQNTSINHDKSQAATLHCKSRHNVRVRVW